MCKTTVSMLYINLLNFNGYPSKLILSQHKYAFDHNSTLDSPHFHIKDTNCQCSGACVHNQLLVYYVTQVM